MDVDVAKTKTTRKMKDARPIRFSNIGIEPSLPVKIRRDKFDASLLDARALGILASPAAGSNQVTIVLGEYQKVCRSRPLAVQSQYLRRHLIRYPSPKMLHIQPSIPLDGLDGALKYMETSGVEVNIGNVCPLLCAAARLGVRDLQRRLEQYLRTVSKLNDSYFLQCWEMCRRAPASVQMREEMLVRAARRFIHLPEQPEWHQINSRLVRRLLMRPEVRSLPVVNLFEAALTWIAGNPSADLPDVDRVISAVPFKRMTKVDRMQCLSKAAEMQLTAVVVPRIAQGSWHQTCVEFDRPSQSDLPVTEMTSPIATDRAERRIILHDEGSVQGGSRISESELLPPFSTTDDGDKEKRETDPSQFESAKPSQPSQIESAKPSRRNKTDAGSEKRSRSSQSRKKSESGVEPIIVSGRNSPVEIPEVIDLERPRSSSSRSRNGGRPLEFKSKTTRTKIMPDGKKFVYTDEVIKNRSLM